MDITTTVKANEPSPNTPEITPVVTASVQKKTVARKIFDAFVEEDVSSVKDYMVKKVIVPTIKRGIVDMVSLFFLGRTSSGSGYWADKNDVVPFSGSTRTTIQRIGYNNMYDGPYTSVKADNRFDYDEILCDSRRDAETLLASMIRACELNPGGVCTIAMMYQMANQNIGSMYTYNDYGWRIRDIQQARPDQKFNGKWSLGLPRPASLK